MHVCILDAQAVGVGEVLPDIPFAQLFGGDALFARCFVEDFDASLARRLGYYDRIVAMGGCSGGPAS